MSEREPVVYIIQNPQRWNEDRTERVPLYDFRPAQHFGRFEFLLKPGANPFNSAAIVSELRTKLKDYRDGDKLLLVGNPALIGFAVAVAAARNGGRVELLQWSNRIGEYSEVFAQGLNN